MAENEKGLHRIEDDLNETWFEDWAGVGVAELEALLAKHAEFLNFLDVQEQSPGQLEEIKVEKVASLGHLVTQETITDIEALEE
jgi:hypothetical protein